MEKKFKPKITIFYCINAFNESSLFPLAKTGSDEFEVKFVEMACSSMVKDVFLLRAFESGADSVVVLVCPEGACRFVEGNLRAKKRIEWVKKLLDEIGLDGKRLFLFNLSLKDETAPKQIIREVLSALDDLGPNPAA